MRKCFFIANLLMVAFASANAAKEKVVYDTVFFKKDTMLVYTKSYETTPIRWNGEYFYLSRKGPYKEIKSKIDGFTLTNNVENGSWTLYYPDGKVYQKKIYKEGNEDGIRETYNQIGELVEKKYYKIGVFYEKALRTEYNESGTKVSEHQINSKKEFDGKYTSYYPTGTPKEVGYYSKGKETGLWSQYDEKGKLQLNWDLTNPKEIIVTGYYPTGEKAMTAFYRKNDQGELEGHGKFIKYYLSGKEEMSGYYDSGLKNGEWQYFDLDGKVMKREVYENDELKEKKF